LDSSFYICKDNGHLTQLKVIAYEDKEIFRETAVKSAGQYVQFCTDADCRPGRSKGSVAGDYAPGFGQ
jgi:hypothetical protein